MGWPFFLLLNFLSELFADQLCIPISMETELSIKIDSKIKELAEAYAKDLDSSLSSLIGNYLKALLETKSSEREVHPLVESLTGVISLDDIVDYKEGYRKYLIEKYAE